MTTVNKWSGVGVNIQTALGTAKTITAIAKHATISTVTATHDYSAGDYVIFSVSGMSELDGRVMRVLSVSTTVSFILEGATGVGLDTTLFGTFASGTCQKVTFGTALATVAEIDSSGGESEKIDITTIHDKARKSMPGIASGMEMKFTHIWDVADAALIIMKAASDAGTTRSFLFSFSGGAKICLNGYVSCTLIPTGSTGGKVTTMTDISALGLPCAFAS